MNAVDMPASNECFSCLTNPGTPILCSRGGLQEQDRSSLQPYKFGCADSALCLRHALLSRLACMLVHRQICLDIESALFFL